MATHLPRFSLQKAICCPKVLQALSQYLNGWNCSSDCGLWILWIIVILYNLSIFGPNKCLSLYLLGKSFYWVLRIWVVDSATRDGLAV